METLHAGKPKKILFVITKGNWGGAQKYVYDLATHMPENNEPVVAFGVPGKLKTRLADKNIRTIDIPALSRNIHPLLDVASFFALLNICRKERPDVIHINSPKAGGLGSLAARITHVKKIVYTAHGWTFNEDRSKLSRALIWFVSWITVLLSHKVIVLGEKEKRQALRMPFARKKIILIRNGIEVPTFLPRDTARARIQEKIGKNINATTPWIGTISELHPNKGLSYAIHSIAELTHAKHIPCSFFIMGEGEERKELEQLIRNKNLENTVFLLGYVSRAAEYLKAFDIFTLTSVKEGLPYALLEAGYAGLPVVTTNVGTIPEIIKDSAHGILVESKNPRQITNALADLIQHPDTRTKLGEALRQDVQSCFSFEHMLRHIQALYNE